MAQDYALRVNTTDPEFPSGLLHDDSGEVLCLSTIDAAIAEAIDRQDRADRAGCGVYYTVVPL